MRKHLAESYPVTRRYNVELTPFRSYKGKITYRKGYLRVRVSLNEHESAEVRSHVKNSPYISRFAPGKAESGYQELN